MIIYTSGTTGRPKGAVTTHQTIGAQISSLISAWRWTPSDRLLLVLPLHHVHGIINGLGCALAIRATCEMLYPFDALRVWDRLASGEITVFTAVPTIYHRLIGAWENASPATQRTWSDGVRRLRLMMSGSAALPVQMLERWRAITGHTLLERYGMTEIGMALSNPIDGERRPGFVGTALPGVEARLVDDQGREVEEGSAGELDSRSERLPGVLAAPGGNGSFVQGRLVSNGRRRGPRARRVPPARPHQRRHHQDRRVQGVRAGDRGGTPHTPVHR
jgi:malonyl-CoA/methylmalonyl-CoA synthetase